MTTHSLSSNVDSDVDVHGDCDCDSNCNFYLTFAKLKLDWFFWRCLPKVAGEEETRDVAAVATAATATVAGRLQ